MAFNDSSSEVESAGSALSVEVNLSNLKGAAFTEDSEDRVVIDKSKMRSNKGLTTRD